MATKTLEQEALRGRDAKALLDNPVLKNAFERLEAELRNRELKCNTVTSPESAADIIRCKQLLDGIKREFTKLIKNGEVAEIQLQELDKKKVAFFNRGY